jgi:hypothetical protein
MTKGKIVCAGPGGSGLQHCNVGAIRRQSAPGTLTLKITMTVLPKSFLTGIRVLALAVCLAPFGRAQQAEGGSTATTPAPNAEIARFGSFLDTHPAIEARLRENVALLNDPVFLKNHPQLANYLNAHPNVKGFLANRPRWFIHRELTRPTQAPAPASSAQVAELDRFLDQHPDLARQLVQRPQLLRQQQFLNSHPALRDYVKQHPELIRPAPRAAAPKAAAPKVNPPANPGARQAAPRTPAPGRAASNAEPASNPP